jgi:hypothetical protein
MKQRLLAWMRSTVGAVRKAVDVQDAHVYGGLMCACVGVAQVHQPGAWVLAGAALFWLGVRK